MTNYITKYCIVRNEKVIIDNKVVYSHENFTNVPDFTKSLYRKYQIKYPKFFKMDNLCKLAFITSEILLRDTDFIKKYKSDEIGVIIANSNSCLKTDRDFHDTIKDKSNYFPSPSVFVYTLPNIMIGEICIKNKIQGEGIFFIFEEFETEFTCNYINNLLDDDKIKSCISGWVEFDGNNYESFLFLIEKENNREVKIDYQPETVKKLYQ